MFLSNLLKLGLHKSSCILFSCLFFVSCTTVSNKPTEVVSNAGSRKIASASAAAMAVNSSAFLAMQACPVLASIQSRIPSWRGTPDRDEHINRYNARYVMNMLQETDSQGRTLHQRLMLELSSNSDCLSRIGDLRENICFYREYSHVCEALYEIDKLKGETIIQEFEEFAGAKIESIDPSQLAGKIDEFINSKGFFKRIFGTARTAVEDTVISLRAGLIEPDVLAVVAGAAVVVAGTALVAVVAGAAVGAGTAAPAVVVGGVVIIGALAVMVYETAFNHDKAVKNRRRPRRE